MGSDQASLLLSEICTSMPKVELHAHLSGSVSDEILMKLELMSEIENKDNKEQPTDVSSLSHGSNVSASTRVPIRSLDECWIKFGEIHEVIKSVETLYWVTCQIIGEFSQDRVIYLELRTSPKKIHGIPSKDAYLKTVIEAIIQSQKDYPIIVKLLVSLDRKMDAKDQEENVELAIKSAKDFPSVVVGMDLSGHPKKGGLNWILPLLEKARSHGLRLSCHLSEVSLFVVIALNLQHMSFYGVHMFSDCISDVANLEENRQLLEFKPERVAHANFVHPSCGGSDHLWQILRSSGIPVEVCITSNVTVGITSCVQAHYVRFLHEESLPYTIGVCNSFKFVVETPKNVSIIYERMATTDDSGVFQTTLSAEYQKLLQVVPLSMTDLRNVSVGSTQYAFASDKEKEQLRCEMMKWWSEYFDRQFENEASTCP